MGGASGLQPAIVFIGFMGAGKSTALSAARDAGLEVHDTDELLEHELGSSISEFFDSHGEGEFRRREEALAGELLERADGGAVALGGGGVLSERVRTALERHVVVWLQVGAEEAWGRIDDSRPLARDHDRFAELLALREPIYEILADTVLPATEPEVFERAMPSVLALHQLPSGTRMAWARSATGEYPAFFGRGLLEHGFWPLEGRRFVVSDTVVGELYGSAIGGGAGAVEVAPGEHSKSLAEAERVLRELTTLGMTREDHVAALGGGVVGDLAGFCAAVYQRGVAVVQVPTTLVAQVDSAYGGKTGVDLPEAKNYVGAYHQPAAVLADPATLETLPREELGAGFVEVIKTALLAGGSLWEQVRAIRTLDSAGLDEIIFACARTKIAVVAEDERDGGRRATLNLGHTVGHAIESASGYGRYRHGEAVGLGLLAALRLSEAEDLRAEVEEILARHSLPTRLDPGLQIDQVISAIERDKKRTADGVGFVLLEGPGEAITGQTVNPDRVRGAVQELFPPGTGG